MEESRRISLTSVVAADLMRNSRCDDGSVDNDVRGSCRIPLDGRIAR